MHMHSLILREIWKNILNQETDHCIEGGWWAPAVWQGLCEDPAADSQELRSSGMWGWVRGFRWQTHCPSRNAQKGKGAWERRPLTWKLLSAFAWLLFHFVELHFKMLSGEKNAKSFNKLKASLLFNLRQVFKKSCWGHPAQRDVGFADEGNWCTPSPLDLGGGMQALCFWSNLSLIKRPLCLTKDAERVRHYFLWQPIRR